MLAIHYYIYNKYYSHGNTLFVCLFLYQPEVSSCMETATNDIHCPVEVAGGRVKPVTVDLLPKLDLTWYCNEPQFTY